MKRAISLAVISLLAAGTAGAADLLSVYPGCPHERSDHSSGRCHSQGHTGAKPQAWAALLPQITGQGTYTRGTTRTHGQPRQINDPVTGEPTRRFAIFQSDYAYTPKSTVWSINLTQNLFSWTNWANAPGRRQCGGAGRRRITARPSRACSRGSRSATSACSPRRTPWKPSRSPSRRSTGSSIRPTSGSKSASSPSRTCRTPSRPGPEQRRGHRGEALPWRPPKSSSARSRARSTTSCPVRAAAHARLALRPRGRAGMGEHGPRPEHPAALEPAGSPTSRARTCKVPSAVIFRRSISSARSAKYDNDGDATIRGAGTVRSVPEQRHYQDLRRAGAGADLLRRPHAVARFASSSIAGSRRRRSRHRHRLAPPGARRATRTSASISEMARVEALKQAVESSETSLKATEAGYEVGTRTVGGRARSASPARREPDDLPEQPLQRTSRTW